MCAFFFNCLDTIIQRIGEKRRGYPSDAKRSNTLKSFLSPSNLFLGDDQVIRGLYALCPFPAKS